MYKIFITYRNVITGETQNYQSTQGYKSAGKAMKVAYGMTDYIACYRNHADGNEYTITVGKVKHG